MMPYQMSISDLSRNLNLRKVGNEYQGACPVCGYKSGFQLKQKRNGKLVGYCHAGHCDLTDFFRVLYMGMDMPTPKGPKRFELRYYYGLDEEHKEQACSKLWETAQSAKGTLVEKYLQSRGLTCPIPPTIAFLKAHRHTESKQDLPVMLAKVNRPGTSRIMGVHRTYLKPDGSGKAAVEPNKKSLGDVKGGGVYLGEPGHFIGVSEGIENGLTFQQATGTPTLAALSAGGLEYLVLPPLPLAKRVTVIADNDGPGMRAAHKASERWTLEGRFVRVIVPPEDGMDLNDLLIKSLKQRREF